MAKYIFIGKLEELKLPAYSLGNQAFAFEADESQISDLEAHLRTTKSNFAIIEAGPCVSFSVGGDLVEGIRFLNRE